MCVRVCLLTYKFINLCVSAYLLPCAYILIFDIGLFSTILVSSHLVTLLNSIEYQYRSKVKKQILLDDCQILFLQSWFSRKLFAFSIFFRIMFHWTMEQPGRGTGKGSPQSPEMSHAIPTRNFEAEQQQSWLYGSLLKIYTTWQKLFLHLIVPVHLTCLVFKSESWALTHHPFRLLESIPIGRNQHFTPSTCRGFVALLRPGSPSVKM